MWAIRGRIVAMTQDTTVAPSESAVFTGRVWIGDDGRIVAVTEGRSAGPPGSAGATVVDVGTSLVVPGLDRPAQSPGLQHPAAVDRAQAADAVPAPQLLDQGRQLLEGHHLARVRADHRLPAGTAGLRRGEGDRRRHHLDPGLAAEEQAAERLAGPQHRRRELRQPQPEPDLRLGAHHEDGRAGRPGQQDAQRLGLHLPLLRGSARQHRGPGVHRRRAGRLPAARVRRRAHQRRGPRSGTRTGGPPEPSPGRRSPTCGSTGRPPTCRPPGRRGCRSASDRTGRRRAPSRSRASSSRPG